MFFYQFVNNDLIFMNISSQKIKIIIIFILNIIEFYKQFFSIEFNKKIFNKYILVFFIELKNIFSIIL